MSASFSVNKEKRPRTPNDSNKSFVKNVTSRMSGLLPTSITKWFSSPSSSKSNGSAPLAESTDSSTEDEAVESPATVQPPAKRMRYSSPGPSHTHIAPEMKCMSTNTEPIETYNSEIQSLVNRNTFRPETKFVSTPLHSPSEESVSSGVNKDTTYHMDNSISSENNSVIRKRKSLFHVNHEEKSYGRNPFSKIKKPYFNAGAYTATPFYPLKTTYSGVSSPYVNQPNVKNRKNTLVTNSSNNDINAISHSARRVLDLLENYSSPLIEAKRISQLLKSSTSNCRNSSDLDDSTTSSSKGFSYKRQELHVPSIATILRIKQRSRLMDTTSAARQIIASHSSSSDTTYYPLPESSRTAPKETGEKFTTKIKSRLTRINRDEKTLYANEEPFNLPTAVLQIDKNNLPKFSLGAPPSQPLNSLTVPATDTLTKTSPTVIHKITQNNISKVNEIIISKPDKASNKSTYQFSSPVAVSNEAVTSSLKQSKFTFGTPERAIEKFSETKTDKSPSDLHYQVVPEIKETTPQPKEWKCDDCWVFNKHDAKSCVCCGGKKPGKDKLNINQCSECKAVLGQGCTGKCLDCQKKGNVDYPKSFSTDQTQCSCQNVDKCICYGSTKSALIDSLASAKPANAAADWRCDICLIRNKSADEKCAACGEANPLPKAGCTKSNNEVNSQIKTTTGSMFKNIVKTQSDKWECSNCLVRNNNNVSKCVCCETEKPGTIKESTKKSFNFGDVPNTTFKFGIDPKQNKLEDKSEPKTFVTSETNNNNLPTTFTFGLPKKKSLDNSNEEKVDKVETPKPAFTFGIPKQTSADPASQGSFNIPNFGVSKLSELTPKTSPQKIEKTEFSQIEQPKPTLPGTKTSNLFSAPVVSQSTTINAEQSFKTPLPVINTPSNVEKVEPINNNILVTPKITSALETTAPQETFSFSSSGIKPAPVNLFSPQETSTSATSSTFSPIQTTPVTPSISYFQKSNPVSTSPLTFFQKSDLAPSNLSLFNNNNQTTITTAAPQPVVSSSPVFSFGNNNTQNAMTQPEKPKFNFTFGNTNKSETPSLFKAPFGSATESNIGTNTFGITNQNTMSTGNMLPGNTLGGMPNNNMPGNILAAGNTGLSAGNTLGGMAPNGNGLDSGNILGRIGLSNSMNAGNNMTLANNNTSMTSSGNLFGSPIKKDNMWSPSNNTSNNMFVSNTMNNNNNNIQKPPAFGFGSSMPFNANKGSTSTFGSQPQPAQNMFGIPSPSNQQPSLFTNQMQSPTSSNIFGSQTPVSNPVPGMFGNSNVGVTPTFGSPNPMNTFEATMNPTPAPAPAPAFNFGAQQQPPAVFGFGQQQQQQQQPQQQPPQPGVYSFGAQPVGMAPAQVQFNMGSAPNIAGRRVRKAIRRTSIR